MHRFSPLTLLAAVLSILPGFVGPAAAQHAELGGCKTYFAQSAVFDRTRQPTAEGQAEAVSKLRVSVRVDCDQVQFFADEAEIYHDRNKVFASGQVLYVSGGSRISADRMEFDTRTRTGTFYNAAGVLALGGRADRSLFGTQEPDATFRGREVHKVGPDKYRIVDGWFTTCVQPTPRWDVSSGGITLNLDDYAWLTNAVFRVKGVPVMYLPAFYYPIQEDDRATGFLLPTYGTSTIKGQMISNAFFWAIGRSHDATIFHDWFSKTGQGLGGEYRYELGGGSQGSLRTYMLNEKETTFVDGTGQEQTTPAARSYMMTGGLTQSLGRGLRARANLDYVTDISVQQRYYQDIYDSSKRTRRFGGNVTGNWREYVLSGTLDRNDYFFTEGDTTRIISNGSLPRITFSRGERPIGRSKVYFGASTEYVTLLRSEDRDGTRRSDQGLTRLEVNPVVRVPFTKWPFLSVNSSVSWRGTYWSESLVNGVQVPESVTRQYFDLLARVTGPVFNRIWNTPGSGYAEKIKHVVEPSVTLQRITAIDNRDQIVRLESTDYTVGGTTAIVYGVTNRVYAKKGVSREILSVVVNQKYYSDANAAQFDPSYQSSFSGVRTSKFGPVRMTARTSPTDRIQGEFNTEWDHVRGAFLIFGATGILNGDHFQATGGWSQRRNPVGTGTNVEIRDHYINGSANVRTLRNRLGGTYTFNYDLHRDRFLQQRYLFYYNAQCCGIGVEYQTYNFSSSVRGVRVPQDRRFNLSFTLAGIGTFSNFLGAFGGQQNR
ncbi:MAG TPA: putative LPS assembly protein LptD [Vicinamibacterales bacterium]|nr:putative LPS assembly protein LptD [Vicinamibacterales bacterium]